MSETLLSFIKLAIELPPNFPAAHAVRTEYPPASGIANHTGTLDLSISPAIMK